MGAWHINRGSYGQVSLDGLGLGFALHSPKAIHLGNMTLALFVDERVTEEQRQALVQIASGQAGGMPFEIIASLVSNLSGPHFVPFQFNLQLISREKPAAHAWETRGPGGWTRYRLLPARPDGPTPNCPATSKPSRVELEILSGLGVEGAARGRQGQSMQAVSPLETVLKRDWAVVVTGLLLIAALTWAYTVYLAYDIGSGLTVGTAMPNMQSWGAVDWVSMFLMWAVMMVAMMVPSAAPIILLFATVNRREQDRPFVPSGVFLSGYLLVWSGLAAAATAATAATAANWSLHVNSLLS